MEYPRRYERALVGILFFTWGTIFLDRMCQLYLAPYFAPVFRLNNQQIGFLASVVSIAWAIGSLFFGAVSDRFGRRTILIPAVLFFSALSWISGLARSYHELLAIRALIGLAEGPCWVAISALLEQSSHLSRRGRNVGIVTSGAARNRSAANLFAVSCSAIRVSSLAMRRTLPSRTLPNPLFLRTISSAWSQGTLSRTMVTEPETLGSMSILSPLIS